MTADNPYRPGSAARAELVHSLSRSWPEYVVLASLALFPPVLVSSFFLARSDFEFDGPLNAGLIVFFLILGLAASWMLWRRRGAGPIASMVFYAMQILNVLFTSGAKYQFRSLPTIYFTLFKDEGLVVTLNLVATILFLLSVRVWREYEASWVEAPPPQEDAGAAN